MLPLHYRPGSPWSGPGAPRCPSSSRWAATCSQTLAGAWQATPNPKPSCSQPRLPGTLGCRTGKHTHAHTQARTRTHANANANSNVHNCRPSTRHWRVALASTHRVCIHTARLGCVGTSRAERLAAPGGRAPCVCVRVRVRVRVCACLSRGFTTSEASSLWQPVHTHGPSQLYLPTNSYPGPPVVCAAVWLRAARYTDWRLGELAPVHSIMGGSLPVFLAAGFIQVRLNWVASPWPCLCGWACDCRCAEGRGGAGCKHTWAHAHMPSAASHHPAGC